MAATADFLALFSRQSKQLLVTVFGGKV